MRQNPLEINIYTEIGLVTLIGLISKHGILMVEFANQLQITEGLSIREAIEKAAAIRLRLQRDIVERGRSLKSILEQYQETVRLELGLVRKEQLLLKQPVLSTVTLKSGH